jgi:hypothetical protein
VQGAVAPGQPSLPQATVAPSLFDQLDVDLLGVQIWHVLAPVAPLVMPLVMNAVPIQHPDWQLPPLHTLPVPQLVPPGLDPLSPQTELPVTQEIVPVLQGSVGSQELPWAQVMQLPPTQTFPAPQLVKLVTGVQVPVVQELHVPQAVLQQIPLTQFPFLHWPLTEQPAPLSFLGVHVPDAQ